MEVRVKGLGNYTISLHCDFSCFLMHTILLMYKHSNIFKSTDHRADEMSQWVMTHITKPDHLYLAPEAYIVDKSTHFCRLTLDLHMHVHMHR